MTEFINFDWGKFRSSLIAILGISPYELEISSRDMGQIKIPLTLSFVYAKRFEYRNSPQAYSIDRRLLNAFLSRLSKTGLFSKGHWLDIGGTRDYGNWLRISSTRYDILNLPGTEEVTTVGNFDEPESIDFSRQYDGVITLNSLLLSRRPEVAVDNIMRLLKPAGLAVLDFPTHHYWYLGGDGDHWSTFYPLQVVHLICPYMDNYLIIPVGNLFLACVDHYVRKFKITASLKNLIRVISVHISKKEHSPRTAMHYVVVGQKK